MVKVLNRNSPSFVEVAWAESWPAVTTMFMSSRQRNPLGEEHADSARSLGFSFDGLQAKDCLCSVPGNVECSVVFVEHWLSS